MSFTDEAFSLAAWGKELLRNCMFVYVQKICPGSSSQDMEKM